MRSITFLAAMLIAALAFASKAQADHLEYRCVNGLCGWYRVPDAVQAQPTQANYQRADVTGYVWNSPDEEWLNDWVNVVNMRYARAQFKAVSKAPTAGVLFGADGEANYGVDLSGTAKGPHETITTNDENFGTTVVKELEDGLKGEVERRDFPEHKRPWNIPDPRKEVAEYLIIRELAVPALLLAIALGVAVVGLVARRRRVAVA